MEYMNRLFFKNEYRLNYHPHDQTEEAKNQTQNEKRH